MLALFVTSGEDVSKAGAAVTVCDVLRALVNRALVLVSVCLARAVVIRLLILTAVLVNGRKVPIKTSINTEAMYSDNTTTIGAQHARYKEQKRPN